MAMAWRATLEQPRALAWDPGPDKSLQGFSLDGKLLGTTTHNDSGRLNSAGGTPRASNRWTS